MLGADCWWLQVVSLGRDYDGSLVITQLAGGWIVVLRLLFVSLLSATAAVWWWWCCARVDSLLSSSSEELAVDDVVSCCEKEEEEEQQRVPTITIDITSTPSSLVYCCIPLLRPLPSNKQKKSKMKRSRSCKRVAHLLTFSLPSDDDRAA